MQKIKAQNKTKTKTKKTKFKQHKFEILFNNNSQNSDAQN